MKRAFILVAGLALVTSAAAGVLAAGVGIDSAAALAAAKVRALEQVAGLFVVAQIGELRSLAIHFSHF